MRLARFIAVLLAACGGELAGADGGIDVSQPTCNLQASSYSKACAVGSDCVVAFMGNLCTATCTCVNDAISKQSEAQYDHDFQAVDAGGLACPCSAPPSPSCCGGQCVLGSCP